MQHHFFNLRGEIPSAKTDLLGNTIQRADSHLLTDSSRKDSSFSSDGSEYSNDSAASKSKSNAKERPFKEIIPPSILSTRAEPENCIPSKVSREHFISDSLSFHLRNSKIASSREDRIILSFAVSSTIEAALDICCRMGWELTKPFQGYLKSELAKPANAGDCIPWPARLKAEFMKPPIILPASKRGQ
jgi:hypothetical protein